MGVGAGLCMYDVVVKTFTFSISSPDFLVQTVAQKLRVKVKIEQLDTSEKFI